MNKTYWIIDNKQGDEFETRFEGTFEEAIQFAKDMYEGLTDHDKKLRDAFYVISDPDEEIEECFEVI